jgi:hypothetical protein
MTTDPLDIQAQERARLDREEKHRLTSRQEADDFKWLMSDKRGRRIVWGLLEKTGLYRTSFTGNSETFFREGARNIGLNYMALINEYCADKYNLMVSEQREHDKRNADDRRRSK